MVRLSSSGRVHPDTRRPCLTSLTRSLVYDHSSCDLVLYGMVATMQSVAVFARADEQNSATISVPTSIQAKNLMTLTSVRHLPPGPREV